MNQLNRSVEVQTDMQQTDADTQSRINELSALVTQLQNDKMILMTELCQLKSQQEEVMSQTDGAADHEVSAEASRELTVMSDQIHELQVTITGHETQLRELNEEKLSLEQQLEKTTADMQATEADYHQSQDAVADLQQQLAAKTSMLEESKDREDDLQKVVEANLAELRQSECKWHEVVEKKEQLVLELRSDLEALTGSVQRREYMWDSARQSMEQEIETMRWNLHHHTADYDSKVQVI